MLYDKDPPKRAGSAHYFPVNLFLELSDPFRIGLVLFELKRHVLNACIILIQIHLMRRNPRPQINYVVTISVPKLNFRRLAYLSDFQLVHSF